MRKSTDRTKRRKPDARARIVGLVDLGLLGRLALAREVASEDVRDVLDALMRWNDLAASNRKAVVLAARNALGRRHLGPQGQRVADQVYELIALVREREAQREAVAHAVDADVAARKVLRLARDEEIELRLDRFYATHAAADRLRRGQISTGALAEERERIHTALRRIRRRQDPESFAAAVLGWTVVKNALR